MSEGTEGEGDEIIMANGRVAMGWREEGGGGEMIRASDRRLD